jgi:hypothetical protein
VPVPIHRICRFFSYPRTSHRVGNDCTGWVFPNHSNPSRPAMKAAVFQAAGSGLNPNTTSDNIPLVGPQGLMVSGGAGDPILALAGQCMMTSPFHNDGLHIGTDIDDLTSTVGDFLNYISCCYDS